MSEKDPSIDPMRVPEGLPPCWWVAVRYADGSTEFHMAANSEREAALHADLVCKQSAQWLRKPTKIEVIAEDPQARATHRFAGVVSDRCHVSARWNWLLRHRQQLVSAAEPKICQVVICTGPRAGESHPKLRNRLGGKALLPEGCAWPTIELDRWDEGRWRRLSNLAEAADLPLDRPEPFSGGRTYATYVGTYDLRDRFKFGEGFPEGISFFLSTYDEINDSYDASSVNSFCQTGVVVPLRSNDDLVFQPPPADVPELSSREVEAWEMPDFPEYGWSPETPHTERTAQGPMEQVYDQVEADEPGTSSWINVGGNKIGGYPFFEQGDPIRELRRQAPSVEWHFIGTYKGPLELGDAGTVYLLAGRNRQTDRWQWHCYWDCA